LVWRYVIEDPRLQTQQHGEKQVIRNLFKLFRDKAAKREFDIFPEPYCEALRRAQGDGSFHEVHVRIVIDLIAGLTETQASRLNARLNGVALGSIHDHL
jgi:dGTPase